MFIHLHCHSHYSLLDGLPKIPDLVNRAKEFGMTSLALTDHGVMYGMIDFYKACKKAGIKPILGVEAYVAPRRHTDKELGVDIKPYHLVLLAKNEIGYKNLLKLTSIAHLDGYYYKPRVDKELLKQYCEGIIATSACLNGEVARHLLSGNYESAERSLWEYKEIFGEGNFYLEVQPHTSRKNNEQQIVNERLIELARKTKTPLVATKDVHYVKKEDAEAQDALLCIQIGSTLDNPDRLSMRDIDCSFSSEEEMRAFFPDLSEAIDNTEKIAEQCNVELVLGTNILPKFEVPGGKTDVDYLRELCEAGLLRRYKEITPEVRERLEWELSVINRMGFASYFLIVSDFVTYAKQTGIVVGPGRGSAAGSIVAYILGVTDLDPIAYKLLFERFLNPDRISMPDIDMDFSDTRRHEVIEYVQGKYGKDRVAGIITFGTMMARAVVRDVGRVMGIPYAEVDRIAKMIPPPVQGRHIPLSKTIEEVAEIKEIYQKNPEIKRLFDLSVKLEGTVRHASQHACGIVIGASPLTEHAPLQKAQGGDVEIVSQYSLHPIEDVGLLKMDFLGLSNLSIIQDTIEIVEAVEKVSSGKEIKIDIDNIPLNDKKTFALLARAETTGVFQLESAGMKRYIKELKPTNIEDIIAMVALYRPGPMQFIESFINRKHGREEIKYMHPSMENALKNTYGIPVYQEQVMQVSKDMAGFTGGEADTLRKAMGKKIAELMAKMKAKFIDGSVAKGIKKELAAAVFQQLEDFAAYGFNRSHAACYAMIAYRTAFLKAHWPNAFMAALMNSDYGNLDRISIEVEECRALGLQVLPPDINESYPRFSVVPNTNKIRFGLVAIKNIGSDIVETIIAERKANGKFQSIEDFLERVQTKNVNKKSMEALIKSGAMDCFGERGEMLANVQKMLDFNREIRASKEKAGASLFGAANISLSRPTLKRDPAPPVDDKQRLTWEKELLGLYISAHPFSQYLPYVQDIITRADQLRDKKDNNWVTVAGLVTYVKQIRTKKNELMCFATLEDLKSSFEVLVFPGVFEKTKSLWEQDKIIIVGGRISFKDGEPKVLVNKAEIIAQENMPKIIDEFSNKKFAVGNSYSSETSFPRRRESQGPRVKPEDDSKKLKEYFNGNLSVKDDIIYITVPAKMKKNQADTIKEILQKYPGETQVSLLVAETGKMIPVPYKVDKEKFV
ncbi:MAG: DNA polymerase III subunit alpha [Patescibacteria group bacterium]